MVTCFVRLIFGVLPKNILAICPALLGLTMKRAYNQITAFVLVYAVMCQFYGQLSTVVFYELNRQALTEQFCVNKNKPERSCFARCYLKSELEKQTPPSDDSALEFRLKLLPLFFAPLQTKIFRGGFSMPSVAHHFLYLPLRQDLFVDTHFRPPAV